MILLRHIRFSLIFSCFDSERLPLVASLLAAIHFMMSTKNSNRSDEILEYGISSGNLGAGMEMRMNSWERQGVRLKDISAHLCFGYEQHSSKYLFTNTRQKDQAASNTVGKSTNMRHDIRRSN